jgi:Na+-transporting NADH:ubiquinone oxidoreductase subunit C
LQRSSTYIIGFATAVCLVCGVVVATSAVALKDRQEANALLDRRMKVLVVAGIMKEGEKLAPAKITELFESRIKPRLVDMQTGTFVEQGDLDPTTYEPSDAAKDPTKSYDPGPNKAKVKRVPNVHIVYQVMEGEKSIMLVLPVEGKGLWSTLYGYLALGPDSDTIKGLTFYQHGETPGLGGEVDNPKWKALWPGRDAFDDEWKPAIKVTKGRAGTVEEAPHEVDGLSGATITANGVTYLLRFWLGEQGFGPFLANLRKGST